MDMDESNKFGMEKGHGDGMPAEWQHFNTPAMSVMPANTSIAGAIGAPLTSSPYLSAPMVEALAAAGHWNQSLHGERGIPSTASAAISSSSISIGKPVAMSPRAMMLSTVPGIFPASLPHFPADSAFVERAARFSCFSGGGGGVNLFPPSQSMTPSSNASKDGMAAQAQKNELHQSEGKVGSLDGSPIKNQRDERSPRIGISNTESRDTRFFEDGQEGNTDSTGAGNSSPSDLSAKRRRKTIKEMEKDQLHRGVQSSSETKKENTESKRKVEQNSSRNTGRDGKDSSAAAKEGYVHVRARRGQATNSHSLAERVRREKISERMKYLQELVPGCSKVTGKAVMLDEIINYVQSLQRQVEFLSMKLATVNPQLDFTIEGLLAKNILHSHGGASSGIGFSQDMIYGQAYPPHQGLVQSGISAMANSPDTFRRGMNTQLPTSGYKEASLQMHNPWNEELLMQMAYSTNPPVNAQETDNKSDGFAI